MWARYDVRSACFGNEGAVKREEIGSTTNEIQLREFDAIVLASTLCECLSVTLLQVVSFNNKSLQNVNTISKPNNRSTTSFNDDFAYRIGCCQ